MAAKTAKKQSKVEVPETLIPNIVVAITALPKHGKTYLMCTFPDPLVLFSFDDGAEYVVKKYFPDKDIRIIKYELPIIETVRALGFKKDILEVWNDFSKDYSQYVEDPEIKTIGIDTATAEYELARIARTGELGRELDPTEYGDVYLRLKAKLQKARINGKNLVLTHYVKEQYGEDGKGNGKYVLDGWKHTEGEVDVVLELALKKQAVEGGKMKNIVQTTIKLNRFDLDINGQVIDSATYDELVTYLGLDA